MELTQNGRYIGMSKKYHIAIKAVQDMRARQSLPTKEHSSTGAKPVAKPGKCAGGHPSRAAGDRKQQQQPRQGEIKQYSANKLKSVTQVPALTSSTLLLLPLRQRRFPAQKAAWLLPECAGKRESKSALQGKQTPSSSRSPSLFICPQLLAIWPRR